MVLMVNEWKYEWINMQHWWNGGDSDSQLESHCTVSSFLVKLLNGEWAGIHHGYCQNVLKHYRNISLGLSHMSAAAHSSYRNPPKTPNHSHVMSCDTPLLCFHMSCPPVTVITRHTHLLSPLQIQSVVFCLHDGPFILNHLFTTYSQPCTFHTHTKQLENITVYIFVNILQTEFFYKWHSRIYTQVHGSNYTCLSASQKGLTFELGWYLNFRVWVKKKNITCREKDKIMEWGHSVGNKTDFAAHLNNAVNFIVV